MDKSKIKVYVGMSGGVDSSLTAALLKEQGYNVIGVYMKNWTQDLPGMKCPWAEDLVATGHYAGVRNAFTENNSDSFDFSKSGTGELLRAKDENKDQTYFLYRVRGEALGRTLLPLGNFTKPEVREMAKERGLFTARKKDSQGICFVGKIGIRDFLKQFIPEQKPGKIINKNTGEVLGWHDGAIFYTLGQRHGLNIGGGLPFYICGKNMQTNEVFVTTDINNGELWAKEINVSALHWINEKAEDGAEIQVRIRHRAPLVNAKIFFENDGTAKIKLTDEQRAITSGQSVVFYSGEVCLGGGIVI